jgi:hypothetical protein
MNTVSQKIGVSQQSRHVGGGNKGIGGHKLIHGYSSEYPLFLVKENHLVLKPT